MSTGKPALLARNGWPAYLARMTDTPSTPVAPVADAPPRPRRGKKMRLEYGELTKLAADLGRSVSHLSRYFTGERPSKALDAEIFARYGVTPDRIVVARTRAGE